MPNTFPRIITVDGIQYMYDINRLKMLSITKIYLKAGTHRRTVTNEYLHLEDGQPSMTVGEGLMRNATIIGITAHTESAHSWTIKVFKKGDPEPLVILPIVSATISDKLTLDRDVPAKSVLLFKAEGTNIPFPRVMLELAWNL